MSTQSSASRVARKPIIVPKGVDIKIEGSSFSISGPKGQMTVPLHPYVLVSLDDGLLTFTENPNKGYSRGGSGAKLNKSITGTTRAKIANLVTGVTTGFERKLLLVGVGYRAQSKGTSLALSIGFSHPVEFAVPAGITIETPTQTEIVIKGADKHLVGHIASTIRAVRSPEPYKSKGIRYSDEKVERKETKKK